MDCNDIGNPALLINYFKSKEESIINRVFKCFNTKYFEEFMLFSCKQILSKWPSTKFKEDELVREAFDEGLFSFYLFIKKNGFEDKGATIKTFFFEFCRRKLLGLVRALHTHSIKYAVGDPEILISRVSGADDYDYPALREEMERKDNKVNLLAKALPELGGRCNNLIRWRKLDKLSNEEISKRIGLEPNSVNNEVYKCFVKLKKIIKYFEA